MSALVFTGDWPEPGTVQGRECAICNSAKRLNENEKGKGGGENKPGQGREPDADRKSESQNSGEQRHDGPRQRQGDTRRSQAEEEERWSLGRSGRGSTSGSGAGPLSAGRGRHPSHPAPRHHLPPEAGLGCGQGGRRSPRELPPPSPRQPRCGTRPGGRSRLPRRDFPGVGVGASPVTLGWGPPRSASDAENTGKSLCSPALGVCSGS